MIERGLPKVCMVTPSYPPEKCGIGDYAALLCEALAGQGVEVIVLTSFNLGTCSSGANPHVRPLMKGRSLPDAMRLLKGVRRGEADIYHFQLGSARYRLKLFFPFCLIPLARLLSPRIRIVLTFHELPSSSLTQHPLKAMVRFIRVYASVLGADALVLLDGAYKPKLRRISSRVESTLCPLIPIASNIPRSKLARCDLKRLRVGFGISDEVLLLSFFGFVNPAKGFENVLEVLGILLGRGARVQLLVLAELSDRDPYQQALLRRIENEDLGRYIRILGYTDPATVANCLAMSDACLLPFVEGATPKSGTLQAAMNQGILTVTTSRHDQGYIRELNVFYAAPGDVEAMVTAVQRFGRCTSRPAVSALPAWPTVAAEHLKLYEQLVS